MVASGSLAGIIARHKSLRAVVASGLAGVSCCDGKNNDGVVVPSRFAISEFCSLTTGIGLNYETAWSTGTRPDAALFGP